MKSVLVHMNDDLGEESRLQVSLDLARAFSGHLQCIETIPFPAYLGEDFATGLGYPFPFLDPDPGAEERLEGRRRSLQKRVEAEGVPWDWICRRGDAAATLALQSRLVDVVVLSHAPAGESYQHPLPLIADLLMMSRTPVLAVPEQWSSLNISGNALVAWDGSAEAAAALRQSISLLQRSDLVQVVTVADDGVRFPPLDPALYLSRHGVVCEVRQCRKEGTVADTLLNLAETAEAAYIVMGSYGHSRVSEYLFGGVTRAMLRSAALPLLLAR